jgi:hypothetical protein
MIRDMIRCDDRLRQNGRAAKTTTSRSDRRAACRYGLAFHFQAVFCRLRLRKSQREMRENMTEHLLKR